MKLHDRVYRDDTTILGTVVATSAEGDADVFEGETVDVKWDANRRVVQTIPVEELDRITPISGLPGSEADAATTLAMITRGVLMSCGARDMVHDNPNGLLMFRVGPERRLAKVIVKLMPSDLFSVEVGHVDRKTFDWVVDGQEHDLFADMLAKAVLRLGDR